MTEEMQGLIDLKNEIISAVKPRGMGRVTNAASSGGQVAVPDSQTIVEGGVAKDHWQIGDPWSDRFYFREAVI